MLTQERYAKIIEILKESGTATVTQLVERLGISESTVRRDLISLDKVGKLIKVHGGATAATADFITQEIDVPTKSLLCVEEKDRIARYAAQQIDTDDFIFLDAGTTTERMIEYITEKKATFVTNGIVHAKKLIQKGIKAYIIGGKLKLSTEAVVGTVAVSSLKQYNFTKSFIGTNGVHPERGFTTPDAEEALLKEEAVARSYMTYVLADHSKFGKISAVTFAGVEKACIITDAPADKKYEKVTIVKEV